MGLIDTGKLKVDYIVASTTTNTQCYRYISKEQVDNAPTVKAIPIEWIEKYLEPYKEHFNKLSDKSKETSGAGWVIDVLETVLREWEKENEIN